MERTNKKTGWLAGIINWILGRNRKKMVAAPVPADPTIEVNGVTFKTQEVANRYMVLLEAQRKGYICDLQLRREFTLREAYSCSNGQRVKAIRFCADFTYEFSDNFYALPLEGDVQKIVRWYKEMRKPGVKPLVVERVGEKPDDRDYATKRKMMADLGYVILEVCGVDEQEGESESENHG